MVQLFQGKFTQVFNSVGTFKVIIYETLLFYMYSAFGPHFVILSAVTHFLLAILALDFGG